MVRRRSHRRSASPCAYSFNSLGRRHGPITHFYRTRADMKIVLCQWSMPAARLCVAQPRPRATTPRKIAVRGTQIITFSSANVRASAWLELAPRRYVLVCNKSGHYSMGMHTSSLVGGGSDLGCRSHASLKYRSSSAIRRGSVIRLRGATVSSWPNSIRAFVMGDRARPFGILHFRRHGPLAFSLSPSRGRLDRDSGL
jgi:hypothetical protein